MVEQKDAKHIAIDIKRAIPLFADNVIVANVIKTEQETSGKKKSKQKKEGYVTLIFVDNLSHAAVARVVVSRQTADALQKALDESMKKFDKEMKSKGSANKIESIVAEKRKAQYLG